MDGCRGACGYGWFVPAYRTCRPGRSRKLEKRKSRRLAHSGLRRDLWLPDYLSRAGDKARSLCADWVSADCHSCSTHGIDGATAGAIAYCVVIACGMGAAYYWVARHRCGLYHPGLGAAIHFAHADSADFLA